MGRLGCSVENYGREINVKILQSLNETIHGKHYAWHTVSTRDINCYYYRQEIGRTVGMGKGERDAKQQKSVKLVD